MEIIPISINQYKSNMALQRTWLPEFYEERNHIESTRKQKSNQQPTIEISI